jgi:hypothetical protein
MLPAAASGWEALPCPATLTALLLQLLLLTGAAHLALETAPLLLLLL